MTIINKSAEIIGEVIGLLIGENTTVPVLQEMEDHPYWYTY
jgi:hypothetical protein